ncbi:MAG TPA: ABC transporter permease [Blastocatellia bacterium]|jgi:peptide/nickel transport system permease protein|nr:ABC transporter permease [Blastocatellia bacterium]
MILRESVADATSKPGTGWQQTAMRAFHRLGRHRPALVGATAIGVFLVAALLADVLAPYDPLDMSAGPRLATPDMEHWFGTDEFGRDVLSRVIYGARIAFTVGVLSASAAAILGSTIGILGGYFGGLVDRAVTMLIDLIFAFPTILLAIAVAAFLTGGGMPPALPVIIALCVVQSPHFARVVRGATLAIKAQPFVEAAHVLGASNRRIIRIHIVPNIVAPLIVQFSLSFSYAILAESSLSFLGVGHPPPAPSWGAMLTSSYGYVERGPWAAFFPGMAITLLILGFNVLGDGLRDFFDPTRR